MPQKKEDLPEWENKQVQRVRDWLNEQLPKGSPTVQNLEKDLSDGVVLITLLEKIKNCTIPGTNKNASTRIHKINNLTVVLNFIEEELDVRLPVIGPEDIVDGNIKLIMGTLWALIRYIAPTDEATKKLHHELSMLASTSTRKLSAPRLAPQKVEEPKKTPARVVVAAQAKKLQEQPKQESKPVPAKKPEAKSNNNNKAPVKDESDTETEEEDNTPVAIPPVVEEQKTQPEEPKQVEETKHEEIKQEEPKQEDLKPEEPKHVEEPAIEKPNEEPPVVQEEPQAPAEEPTHEEPKHEELEPTPAQVEEPSKQVIAEESQPEITTVEEAHEQIQEPKQDEQVPTQPEEVKEPSPSPPKDPQRRKSIFAMEEEKAEIEVAAEVEIIPPIEEKQEEPSRHEEPSPEPQPEPEPAKQEAVVVVQETTQEAPQSELQEKEQQQKSESEVTPAVVPAPVPVLDIKEERARTSSVDSRKSPIQSPRSHRSGSVMQRKNSVYSPPALPITEKVEREISNSPFLTYYDPEKGKLCTYRIVLETTNIGRRNDNDVVLISKYISRYHARIDTEVRKEGTVLVFKDLDSSGGSRVNGGRATNKPLEKGDQIKMGKTVILYSGRISVISGFDFQDKSDKLFLNNIIKEGPGYKQSSSLLKSWQARYFVLQGHVLFYFKSKKERTSNQFPDGFIDIDQCIIEQDEKNWFTLRTSKQPYSLKFNPPDEKEEWLDAIRGR